MLLLSHARERIWPTTAPPWSRLAPELQLILRMEHMCLCACREGPEAAPRGKKRSWRRFTTAAAQRRLGGIRYAMAALTPRMPQPAKNFSQGFAY